MTDPGVKAARTTLRKKTAKFHGDMDAALKEIAIDLSVLPSCEGNKNAWYDRRADYDAAYRELKEAK